MQGAASFHVAMLEGASRVATSNQSASATGLRSEASSSGLALLFQGDSRRVAAADPRQDTALFERRVWSSPPPASRDHLSHGVGASRRITLKETSTTIRAGAERYGASDDGFLQDARRCRDSRCRPSIRLPSTNPGPIADEGYEERSQRATETRRISLHDSLQQGLYTTVISRALLHLDIHAHEAQLRNNGNIYGLINIRNPIISKPHRRQPDATAQ